MTVHVPEPIFRICCGAGGAGSLHSSKLLAHNGCGS